MSDGKYYWLKMKRDFFRRHDIRIIHNMENGRDIVLFYIELMIESVDHEGTLRFSKDKPYTNGMLASLTNTPTDIVELAMNTLIDFDLIEIDEDKTIILPKVIEMIDSAADNDNANRQRRYREAQKTQSLRNVTECVTKSNASVTECVTNDNESIEIRDKRLDIERNTKERKFKKPTLEEISSYCQERNNSVDAQRFFDYYESKGWLVGKSPMKDWKAAVRNWERNDQTATHCPAPKKNPYDIDWESLGVKT